MLLLLLHSFDLTRIQKQQKRKIMEEKVRLLLECKRFASFFLFLLHWRTHMLKQQQKLACICARVRSFVLALNAYLIIQFRNQQQKQRRKLLLFLLLPYYHDLNRLLLFLLLLLLEQKVFILNSNSNNNKKIILQKFQFMKLVATT